MTGSVQACLRHDWQFATDRSGLTAPRTAGQFVLVMAAVSIYEIEGPRSLGA